MPRTDEQIVEYMRYYAGKSSEERKWALKTLASTEGKTPAEIRAICEKYTGKEEKPMNKLPDELREEVKQAIRDGMGKRSITEKFRVSETTVNKIRAELRNAGEQIPVRGKIPAAEPQKSVVLATAPDNKPVPIRPLNMFAVLLAMQEFVNSVAESGEITEAAVAGTDAHISFRIGGNNYGLELKHLES